MSDIENEALRRQNQEMIEQTKQMFREKAKASSPKAGESVEVVVGKPEEGVTKVKSQEEKVNPTEEQLKPSKRQAKLALVFSGIVFIIALATVIGSFRCLIPCQGSDCNVCGTAFFLIIPLFVALPTFLFSLIPIKLISNTTTELLKYQETPEVVKLKKKITASHNLLYTSAGIVAAAYCLYLISSF